MIGKRGFDVDVVVAIAVVVAVVIVVIVVFVVFFCFRCCRGLSSLHQKESSRTGKGHKVGLSLAASSVTPLLFFSAHVLAKPNR